MERESKTFEVVVANGESESGAFELAWAAGAGVITPAALDATTCIAFKVSDAIDGTFLPLYDDTNAVVEITVELAEARAYVVPDGVFAWRYAKLWMEAAGGDVGQSADRTFIVSLKS